MSINHYVYCVYMCTDWNWYWSLYAHICRLNIVAYYTRIAHNFIECNLIVKFITACICGTWMRVRFWLYGFTNAIAVCFHWITTLQLYHSSSWEHILCIYSDGYHKMLQNKFAFKGIIECEFVQLYGRHERKARLVVNWKRERVSNELVI